MGELWNANIIKKQNEKAIIASYRNAGHIFAGEGVLNTPNMRIKTGGNIESNEKASIESEKTINDFLLQHHKRKCW